MNGVSENRFGANRHTTTIRLHTMNFELFAAPKTADKPLSELPPLIPEFDLRRIPDTEVVWSFSAELSIKDLFGRLDSVLTPHFEFGIVALDGSENNLAPNQAASNKPYLDFCLRRSRNEPSNDLLPIREHFERHLQRVESKFRSSQD